MSAGDVSQHSLLDLFRQETEAQVQVLISGLLTLERDHHASQQLEACMRAAHSLKGAARIVDLESGVRAAHAMEDCFVAAQRGLLTLTQAHIDVLLAGADLLARLAGAAASPGDADVEPPDVEAWLASIEDVLAGRQQVPGEADHTSGVEKPVLAPENGASDQALRVTPESLNRLLGLAGESLVESRWVKPFTHSLMRLKRLHYETSKTFNDLRDTLSARGLDEQAQAELISAQHKLIECREFLAQRMEELELFDRRSIGLSQRLYDEALACRMRPFGDIVQGFPRMVRNVARALGKQVVLTIVGETTQVDREILGKLEAPLGHLLRNAVDHGFETPEERLAAGKPPEGEIRLEARHHAGALYVSVRDDGRGIDLARLRQTVVARRLTNEAAAQALSDSELFEFLFLPGFTMSRTVSDISGRGVGLDVVRDMVKQVRGTVRASSQVGRHTLFELQLPVTLSVLRALLVEVAGEPYAIPLASIIRIVKLVPGQVESLEGRQHFDLDGRRVGLVTAGQVLEIDQPPSDDAQAVIVLGDATRTYGVIVDRLLGERELVVQPLDAHIARIRDIAAGALMEDGSPVLILDSDDLVQSIDKLVSSYRPAVRSQAATAEVRERKRVLVVDDSLTVRELERKLLTAQGYDVEVAVDGMDGWNLARSGQFSLVVTDIDMPRMDGIELVTLINNDQRLRNVPVMIVSYKDRDEDRRRGLEAGAARYLTKGSFHDETLVRAVVDLIGEPHA